MSRRICHARPACNTRIASEIPPRTVVSYFNGAFTYKFITQYTGINKYIIERTIYEGNLLEVWHT